MYPHRIRLRGPWEYEPLARRPADAALPLPPPGRMTLPCRWAEGGLAGFVGQVRFRRRFGYPGQIDADERVWLTCEGIDDHADVSLNGVELGRLLAGQPFEYDVTTLLQPRNELRLEVEGGLNGGLWGEVALEVRCTAFLRQVQVRTAVVDDQVYLDLTGLVAGISDRPLELYAIHNRSNILYARLEAAPAGQPFQLRSDPIPRERYGGTAGATEPPAVQIDLVNSASVWYRIWKELPSDPAAGSGT